MDVDKLAEMLCGVAIPNADELDHTDLDEFLTEVLAEGPISSQLELLEKYPDFDRLMRPALRILMEEETARRDSSWFPRLRGAFDKATPVIDVSEILI